MKSNQLLFCAIVYSVTALIHERQDVIDMPEIVPRLNWGVVFYKTTPILNGFQTYTYTMTVLKPDLNYRPIKEMKCQTDGEFIAYCHGLNGLITKINSNFETEHQRLQKTFKSAFKNIPKHDEKGERRNKRSAQDSDLPSLNVDFCSEDALDKMGDDSGFWASLGKAFTKMTGRPTKDDMAEYTRKMCELVPMIRRNREEIKKSKDKLASICTVMDKRITKLKEGMTNLENQIVELQKYVTEFSQHLNQKLDNLQNRIGLHERAQEQFLRFEASLLEFETETLRKIEFAQQWLEGFYVLLEGYVPPFLVPPHRIKEMLNHVKSLLKNNEEFMSNTSLRIVHPSVAFYYQNKDIVFSQSKHYLILMIKIPVTETGGGLLGMYRVRNLHIRTAEHLDSSYKIVNLPDFLAVAPENKTYFIEMSIKDVYSCSGENIKICPLQKPLRSASKITCAAALFYDETDTIIQKCDIRFEDKDQATQAVSVDVNKYLVHVQNVTNRRLKSWTVNCPSYSYEQIPSCNTCLITVPCGCIVNGGDFYIPARLTGCDIDGGETHVKTSLPVSLASAWHIFPSDLIKVMNGSSTYPPNNKKHPWGIPGFFINLTKKSWNQVVEKEKRYQKNFTKMMIAYKNHRQIFASKSLQMLREASDMNEFDHANLRAAEKDFSLSYFTKNNILSSISVFWLVAGSTTIITFYNCYRLHFK